MLSTARSTILQLEHSNSRMLVLVLLPIELCLLPTFDCCYRFMPTEEMGRPINAPVGINMLSHSGLNSYPGQRVLTLGDGKFFLGTFGC